MSRLLLCVSSYNRGDYLTNLIRSIERFLPDHDVLVIDDSSDDNKTLQTLANLKKQGVRVITNTDRDKNKHGGLYHCMNKGLEWAKDEGYDYIYFLQDDMQIVRAHVNLVEELDELFGENENLLQLNYNFLWKITQHHVPGKFEETRRTGWWQKKEFGVADTGIISVSRADQFNLHFANGERETGKRLWEEGARLWLSCQPHACWVPFPNTYRHKTSADGVKKQAELPNQLLVEPLTDDSVNKLLQNTDPAFLEDYTRYHKKALYPYWYQATKSVGSVAKAYVSYYVRSLFA